MDPDEREIFQFLKSRGGVFVPASEIARRASGKRRFYDDPNWAKPFLIRMSERHILESDSMGRYRIKPVSRKGRNKRWVAPDIAKVLQEGEVQAESEGEQEIGPDEYYEEL